MKKYFLTLLLLLGSVFSLPSLGYKKVVSINLCTDQLLYLLEDKENIASVSFLSIDPDYSYLAEEMKEFHINSANVEEIIPLQPDLILAVNYTSIHTVHFLRNLDFNIVQIDIPYDMQHIEDGIIQVGKLLNKTAKAQQILDNMRQRRNVVQLRVANKKKPLAIILAPNGYTHGKGSMKGDLLELAGYRNLAAEAGIQGSGNINLETLVKAQPDYLIIEDSTSNNNSMAQRFLKHPALKNGLPNMQRIYVNPNLWTCGGPSMIDALEILADAHP